MSKIHGGVIDYTDIEKEKTRQFASVPAQPPSDPVHSPEHYTLGGIETIDFIEAKGLGYHLGNAVKYISRAGHKGDAEQDIQKARWYLNRWLQIKSTERLPTSFD